MASTAADILVDTLHDWGVDVVFGLPGDGINGIMEALRTRQEDIRFIHVRHEEAAAFMACAYAKYTGKLGVCLGTSGPGGIHLLNGLYDAKLDGQPVVAITGHCFHDLIGTLSQQDVDLDKLFMDVAAYNVRVMGPAHVKNVTDLACRTALARGAVAHINIPTDIQEMVTDERSARNVRNHTEGAFARGTSALPEETQLRAAANVLKAGEKIAILCGQGALGATAELEKTADVLGAPIIKALLGKAAVPDDSPYTTGGIGLLGTLPSQEALEQCDTLLMVGTSFPYMEFLPKPGRARGVQIDVDPMRIGLRFPVEVGLVGDAGRTLRALLPFLEPNRHRSFLDAAQKGMVEWWELMKERGTRQDRPMKPQVIAWELGKRLSPTAILSADSGTNTTWFARQIPIRRGQMCSLSGTLASMANGLPYAIAAQVAYPDRQCVAFVGDGGLSMLMGELATVAQHRLPVKIIVIKNNTLGQIKWEQMVFLGNPEFACDLFPIDFAGVARACGIAGFTVDDPAQCGAVLDEALSINGPALIEAVVDPLTPPMPAKITVEQAAHLTEALARGTADAGKILRTVMADKIKELV